MMLAAAAGWVLVVFRFSMTVFFVIVPQSCLHVCTGVRLSCGVMTSWEFFGYG